MSLLFNSLLCVGNVKCVTRTNEPTQIYQPTWQLPSALWNHLSLFQLVVGFVGWFDSLSQFVTIISTNREVVFSENAPRNPLFTEKLLVGRLNILFVLYLIESSLKKVCKSLPSDLITFYTVASFFGNWGCINKFNIEFTLAGHKHDSK